MLLDQKRLLAGNCRTPCDVKLANENAHLAKTPVFFKKKKQLKMFRSFFPLLFHADELSADTCRCPGDIAARMRKILCQDGRCFSSMSLPLNL